MEYINIDYQGRVNNREPIFDDGVHQQDIIGVSHQKLVEIFGEPNVETDGFKIDAYWLIFTAGGVATILPSKDRQNYLDDDLLEFEEITLWQICAHSAEPIHWIKPALGLYQQG